ncbi:MAG TPA: endonuclease/exonuclease/phosphatase family protein [Longimicrobium sp.]|nr:endonuclease/exonuclease/phosphatase family protein [Longimicrobium sp.]
MIHRRPIHLCTAAVLALSFSGCGPPSVPAPPGAAPVVLDGLFGEWEGFAPAVLDPADAPAPYADVRAVRVRHDEAGLYLDLSLEREVSLQGLPGTLVLMLDWTSPDEGWEAHGMRGVDATLEFSPTFPQGGGLRGGIGVRMMDSAGGRAELVTANVAGVITAPTHASERFEMRIARGGVIPAELPMTARLVALNRDGRVVDETETFAIHPGAPRPRPTPPGSGAADPLARAPGTDVRVVSWNVGREDLFRQPDAFGIILRALAPDLLVLDEVAGGHSAEEVEALLNRVVPDARPWRAVYGVSGGSQRGVIATRGAAPLIVPPFDRIVPYPDSLLASVPADAPAQMRAGAERRMADGVPTLGAVVQVGGRRMLAVTMDLESGGAPGGPQDRLRRMEATAIRAATENALREAGPLDGWLIAGDLNLVSARDPLRILVGTGMAGGELAVAFPLRLDGASATTWDNPVEPFTPGRLDYLLHPPSLAVAGGFVFSSTDLAPRWRERYGMTEETSRATDHLPVVTDLRRVAR